MDPVSITITITATPDSAEPFTEQDLYEAAVATLHEVLPVDGGMPVVPTVALKA